MQQSTARGGHGWCSSIGADEALGIAPIADELEQQVLDDEYFTSRRRGGK